MGFHGHIDEVFCEAVDLLAQYFLLQQMAEGQDRRLIGDPITDQLDAGTTAQRGHLDEGFFHGRVAERIPLLLQVDAEHRGQRVRKASTYRAGSGVVRLDQIDECLAMHHLLHLSQKLLALGALLGRGLLVIAEGELLAAHQPCVDLALQLHSRVDRLGSPE